MDKVDKRIIELCVNGKKRNTLNYKEISEVVAKEFGVVFAPESIRSKCKRYRKANGLDENFQPQARQNGESIRLETEVRANGDILIDETAYWSDRNQITQDALLEKHGFKKEEFEVVSFKTSTWDSVGDGKKCYSAKICVKPKKNFVWTQETIDKILDGLNIEPDKLAYKQTNYGETGLYLVLPIVDLHANMRASIEATGVHYDLDEAERLFWSIIDDVCQRIGDTKFEKIFFVIGNDLLNADNKAGTTTKGTPQDNYADIEKAIVKVTNMLIRGINKLKRISCVDVIHVPSNHDYIVSFGIANALRARFLDDPRVDVDCSYRERKYRVIGKTLVGFAHDVKNIDKINDVIQADARAELADTTNTVYLLAHKHHEERKDVAGTDVMRLPTVSPLSRWAYDGGYSSVRKSKTLVIDDDYGITDILYTFVKD